MIITWILSSIVTILSVIFSILPSVTTLPDIGGYNIDGALVNGVGQAYNFANSVWVVKDVLLGATFIWGYYALKMLVRLLIGHRAPS